LFVGVGQRQDARVGPQAAEQRDAEWIAAVADEPAGDGDLRQTGERALLARAWLAGYTSASSCCASIRRTKKSRKPSRLAMNSSCALRSSSPAGVGASAVSNRRALTGA